MLGQIGCIVKAEDGILKVIKGSMVIMKGSKVNSIYMLNGQTTTGELNVTDSNKDRSKLWHRIIHISERDLKELKKQRVFGNDKRGSLGFCEDFIIGKASKIKFQIAVHTTKDKLN